MCLDFDETGWCGHMKTKQHIVEIVEQYLGRDPLHEKILDSRPFASSAAANVFVKKYNAAHTGGQGYWSGMPIVHARRQR